MKPFVVVYVCLCILFRAGEGLYGIPNCTNPCPNITDVCWDTTINTGDCDGEIGPVYTEIIEATDCSNGCWKAISVIFAGTPERSGDNHNVYARMLYPNGSYVTSPPYWTGYWGSAYNEPDGYAYNIPVSGEEWGNFAVWASDPDWEPYTCHVTFRIANN